ncbi:hypothetical protein V5O48_009280 [Marasmius crinis-equi]|uniref:Uncharacterized protein n=1 Tax=Marasmius crinis-equi TaxID=585013 RepID=A0ABR3FBQ4_9AGAR
MSTAPSTPTQNSNDDFSFMNDAMDIPSSPIPTQSSRKRKRSDNEDNGNGYIDEDDADLPSMSALTAQTAAACSRNVLEKVNRYATKKKLRPEQLCEVEKFLQDREAVQRGKLYVECLAVQNMVETIVIAQPPYAVSKEMKTNIDNYAWGILLSPTLRTYKGAVPKEHLLAIIKKFRFDLPPGIEHNTASWEKVTTQVETSLTQIRSAIKKAIRASVSRVVTVQNKANNTKKQEHERVSDGNAQNRLVWIKDPTETFWNTLDARLNSLYEKADKSEKKLRKAFEAVLDKDRKTYGVDTGYNIPAIGSEFQQNVDQMLTVRHINSESSSAAPNEDGSDDEGQPVAGATTPISQPAT